jgi:hypothetical protein
VFQEDQRFSEEIPMASTESERSGDFPCLFVSEKLIILAVHDYIEANVDLGEFRKSSLFKGFYRFKEPGVICPGRDCTVVELVRTN